MTLNEEKQNRKAKRSPGKRKGVSCLFNWVNPHLINLQMLTDLMQKRYESEKESHTELIP